MKYLTIIILFNFTNYFAIESFSLQGSLKNNCFVITIMFEQLRNKVFYLVIKMLSLRIYFVFFKVAHLSQKTFKIIKINAFVTILLIPIS